MDDSGRRSSASEEDSLLCTSPLFRFKQYYQLVAVEFQLSLSLCLAQKSYQVSKCPHSSCRHRTLAEHNDYVILICIRVVLNLQEYLEYSVYFRRLPHESTHNIAMNATLTEVDQEVEIGFGSELQHFVEREACLQLVASICKSGLVSSANNIMPLPQAKEELDRILLKYLEQPLLVSPHIPELVGPLNDVLTAAIEDKSPATVRAIFF